MVAAVTKKLKGGVDHACFILFVDENLNIHAYLLYASVGEIQSKENTH